MWYMQHICHIYVPHISQNFAYFPAYFASECSAYFRKILRYKPTSLVEVANLILKFTFLILISCSQVLQFLLV